MDDHRILRYAVNLADFMRHVSVMLKDSVGSGPETMIPPADHSFDEDTKDVEADTLEDIGLDDTSIMAIIIELSQDRTTFKMWVPYDPEFNEALKHSVPKRQRWFDREERCWRVSTEWFGNAQRLLLEFFPDLDRRYTDRALRMCETLVHEAEVEQQEAACEAQTRYKEAARRAKHDARKRYEAASKRSHRTWEEAYDSDPEENDGSSKNNPYLVLGVQPDAPDEVVKAAHKAQARKHHTDLGGDRDMMARINAAFEEIGRERGWKT